MEINTILLSFAYHAPPSYMKGLVIMRGSRYGIRLLPQPMTNIVLKLGLWNCQSSHRVKAEADVQVPWRFLGLQINSSGDCGTVP